MIRQLWLTGAAIVLTSHVNALELCAAAVPSGSFIVASDANAGLRWVDPQTGQIIGNLDNRAGAGALTLGPNGLLYVAYPQERLVREMNPLTAAVTDTISVPAPTNDVRFGPDGRLYISAAGFHPFGGVFVYDLATRRRLRRRSSGLALRAVGALVVLLPAGRTGGGFRIAFRRGDFARPVPSHVAQPKASGDALGPAGAS
jgi:hypothetical protein